MDGSNFIFITGTGRSGTNILKELLAKHTQVASLPFEHRFTVDPRGVYDFLNTYPSYWSPYWADHKIKDLEDFLMSLTVKNSDESAPSKNNTTPVPYNGWELNKWIPDYEQHVRVFIEQLVEFSYEAKWPGTQAGIENNKMYFADPNSIDNTWDAARNFVSTCYHSICKAQAKAKFVEDNTHSLLLASTIYKLFPEAKMIHMVRDPRDVIASLMRQKWAPSELSQTIAWYNSVMQTWNQQKHSINPRFYIEIRLEDLIENGINVCKKIKNHIGIDVTGCIESMDLSNGNIGRHLKELSSKQIDEINSSVKSTLEQYGYR